MSRVKSYYWKLIETEETPLNNTPRTHQNELGAFEMKNQGGSLGQLRNKLRERFKRFKKVQ